jgi:hypothetical protein
VAMRLAIGERAQPTAAPPTTGSAPGGMNGMPMSPNSMKMK